ncbi:SH3 domain-containing protein [Pediococcus acidilactici]
MAIRNSPNRTAKKVGSLDQYQKVTVVSKSNDWYRIRFDDTKTGWIPSWITNRTFKKGQKETPLAESKIVLDPGHGGVDSGALAINQKHQEKKIYVADLANHPTNLKKCWSKGYYDSR